MKKQFIFLFSLWTIAACAQKTKKEVSISVTDDGQTYTIDIRGEKDDKTITYNHNYNVSGMTSTQKEGIKQRVLDSLDLIDTPNSKHEIQKVTFICPSCKGKCKLEIRGEDYESISEVDSNVENSNSLFPMVLEMKTGEYKFVYRQNNELIQTVFEVKADSKNIITIK